MCGGRENKLTLERYLLKEARDLLDIRVSLYDLCMELHIRLRINLNFINLIILL